ncbi:hypothetical protein [Halomonas sp. WWR20]
MQKASKESGRWITARGALRLRGAVLGMLMLATTGMAGQAQAERPQVELRDSKRLHPEVRRHSPGPDNRRHGPDTRPRVGVPRVEIEVNDLSTFGSSRRSPDEPARRTGEDSPPPGASICRDGGGTTWSTRGQECEGSSAAPSDTRTYSTSPR